MISFTDFLSLLKMPLEQLARVEQLLFIFPEPFNEKQTQEQFRISNKTKPSRNKLIYYQKILLEQLVEILDNYINLYKRYGKTFTELLPTIEKPYYFLNLSLKDIECHPNFPHKILYAKYDSYLFYFNSITKDPETTVNNWNENRSKVIDLIAYLKNFLFNYPLRRKIAQLNKRLASTTKGQVEIKESGQGSYHMWYNIKA
jgi:hypothetical protein